jgi:hypothetical protein
MQATTWHQQQKTTRMTVVWPPTTAGGYKQQQEWQQQDHQHSGNGSKDACKSSEARMQGRLTTTGTPLELGDYRSNMDYRNIWMSTTAELDSNSREACNIQHGRQQQQQRYTPYRKVLLLVLPNHQSTKINICRSTSPIHFIPPMPIYTLYMYINL